MRKIVFACALATVLFLSSCQALDEKALDGIARAAEKLGELVDKGIITKEEAAEHVAKLRESWESIKGAGLSTAQTIWGFIGSALTGLIGGPLVVNRVRGSVYNRKGFAPAEKEE